MHPSSSVLGDYERRGKETKWPHLGVRRTHAPNGNVILVWDQVHPERTMPWVSQRGSLLGYRSVGDQRRVLIDESPAAVTVELDGAFPGTGGNSALPG